MKKIIILSLCFISVSSWAEDLYTANYDLYWAGINIGVAERKLSKNGNTYSFSSVAKPKGLAKLLTKGLVEKSKFTVENGKVKTLEYFYDQKGKKSKRVKHNYKWSNKSLYITEPKKLKVNGFSNNTVDLLSFQYLISLGLEKGQRSFVAEVYKKSPKPKVYKLKVRGTETVKTPAGKFQAIKVSREPNDGKSFSLWVVKELGYVPVKIEYATKRGDLARMLMTKINFGSK